MLYELIEKIISLTAVQMRLPEPYGAFHLIICLIFVPAAVSAALMLGRRHGSKDPGNCRLRNALRKAPENALGNNQGSVLDDDAGRHRKKVKTIRICGIIMLVSEIYKQLFLYMAVNEGGYNFWYLPFQLCSIPMYLCLMFPRFEKTSAVFMSSYGLLGAVMTLIFPDGIMYTYAALTIHGFMWHFMLIFVGIYCMASGLADRSFKAFIRTIPLFLGLAAVAFIINLVLGAGSGADMFYISPYLTTAQPVFKGIAERLGRIPEIIIYLVSIIVGAGFINRACACLYSIMAE